MFKALFLLFFLSSCIYVREIPVTADMSLEIRQQQSDMVRQERYIEAVSYSLAEKEAYFLGRFADNFIIRPHYLVQRYHIKNSKVTSAYLDESTLYLSYLSFKNRAEQKIKYRNQARKIIRGIYYLDSLNNFDGYLPRYVHFRKGVAEIANEPARTNSYSLLFFSYYLAYNYFDDPIIKADIQNHIALIVKYFLKNDLELRNPQGEIIKYSNLKSSFNISRKLDALVIFEIANKIITEPKLKSEITKTLNYFYKKKYHSEKNKLFLSLGFWEASTPSSNWLNMMKLYILARATNQENYHNLFKKLHNALENKQNIFFTLLYDDLFPQENISLKKARVILESYPLSLNGKEIINSQRSDVLLKRFPKIIKHSRATETIISLPIYDRPLKYFEWKHTQFRVDGNLLNAGKQEYPAIDFLIANILLESSNNR